MAAHAIDYDDLLAYAFGDLATERANDVSSHVATCAAYATTVARLELVRGTVRADALAAPSAAALAHVLQLADSLTAPATEPRSWFRDSARRLIATLSYDGRETAAMAGLRGTADAYLLSFQAERGVLDLNVEPPGSGLENRWLITGQLSVRSGRLPADVAIVPEATEGGPPVVTTTDEHGVFTVDLDPGRYEIHVDLADGVLVFPGVETG